MAFTKIKNREFDLEKELNLLLKQIESVKDAFDLYEIYKIIGTELEKLGIALVITVPDKRKINIVVKYLNKAHSNISLPYKEEDKLYLDTLINYKKTRETGKSVFFGEHTGYLKRIVKHDISKERKTINSIISPLILRGEIVGFFEFFSEEIKKSDTEGIDNFSRELVVMIANMILFSELQKSENKYRNLFEKAKDGFYVLNGKMRKFVDVNQALCDISGYTRGELLQMNVIMLFEQDERRRIEEYIENRIRSNKGSQGINVPRNYQTKILTKNKKIKDVEINIVQFVSSEEWFVSVADITERKRIKKALEESTKRYQLLAENVSDLISVVDNNTLKFTYFSPSIKKILGYDQEELFGLELSRLLTEGSYKKTIKEFNRRFLDESRDKHYSDKPVILEIEKFHRNGHIVIMEMTASLMINGEGRTEGILMVGRDITERKKTELALLESEKKYRSVFENSGTAIITVNINNIIITANAEFKKLSGCSKEEIEGKVRWIDFIDVSENKIIKKNLLKINKNKFKSKKEYNLKFIDRYNKEKNVLVDISLIPGIDWFVISFKDYTQLKKTEEAFRQSEEKYKELVTNASDIIACINNKGFVTLANTAFEKISGYSRKEILKLHFSKLIHPEDLDEIMDRFARKMRGDKIPNLPAFKTIGKEGNIRDMSMTSSQIIENGEIVGLQVILRDVTENRKLLKQIEGSKKHYEQVIDTMEDAICVIDEKFRIVSTNKAFAKKVNLKIKKIKKRRCQDVLFRYSDNLFVGDCDREKCLSTCRLANVFKTKKDDSFVKKSIDNDNQAHYHRINIFFSKQSRYGANQVVIVIRDITKSKIAEDSIRKLNELNKSIMDNIPVSIITINKKGMVTSVNKYTPHISSDRNMVGKILFEDNFFKENNLVDAYKDLLKKGEVVSASECATTNMDNEKIYLNIIAVPIMDKKNIITGAVSMAWNNTEEIIAKEKIKALNEKLEKTVSERTWQLGKANKELVNVLELKSKFISDASHELRTPLTIIQGNIDLAIQAARIEKKDVSEEYFIIYKEVQRMTGIISDLTILTNADANKEKVEYEPVYPIMLIKNTIDSLQILAKQKNLQLKIRNKNFPKNLYIRGDEAKLEKLLLNIVRNAIKYTEPNGWVKLGIKDRKTGILISVEDNGIGIPKQDIPYIFERFYRVDKARSRDEGGTGLGLSICKWIAEIHSGKIKVESKEGVGTTFSVLLPYDFKKGGIEEG